MENEQPKNAIAIKFAENFKKIKKWAESTSDDELLKGISYDRDCWVPHRQYVPIHLTNSEATIEHVLLVSEEAELDHTEKLKKSALTKFKEMLGLNSNK